MSCGAQPVVRIRPPSLMTQTARWISLPSEVCLAWALDWRWKSFAGRVGSNRELEATARRAGRRETPNPGAVRPCGEEARGEPQHRTRVKPCAGRADRVSVPSNATPKIQPRSER